MSAGSQFATASRGRRSRAGRETRAPRRSSSLRVGIDRRRAGLLGELLARRVDRRRDVQVARRRVAEQALQVDLPRRRIEQVGAAHHVGDALLGVVDHHRELVGELPVGAIQHEVADVALERSAAADPGRGRRTRSSARSVLNAQRARRLARRRARRGRCRDRSARRRPRGRATNRRSRAACSRTSRCCSAGARSAASVERARAGSGTATGAVPGQARAAPACAGCRPPRRAACAARRGPRCAPASGRRAARASSQLASAATSEPKCSGPVGEGANRPTYMVV